MSVAAQNGNGVTGTGSRRRYPAKVMRLARRLDEKGYRLFQIETALAQLGYHPSKHTIRRWISAEVVEYDRARRLRPARKLARSTGWFVRFARMRELRRVGLSCGSVAAVMNLDHGLDLTAGQVRGIFNATLHPENVRALLSGHRISPGRKGPAPA